MDNVTKKVIPLADDMIYYDVDMLVSGWGLTSSGGSGSPVLRGVIVRVIEQMACKSIYGYYKITPQMFCAAASGKDACQVREFRN